MPDTLSRSHLKNAPKEQGVNLCIPFRGEPISEMGSETARILSLQSATPDKGELAFISLEMDCIYVFVYLFILTVP
jgi:hypothetical protein